jgi:hypothetical protein
LRLEVDPFVVGLEVDTEAVEAEFVTLLGTTDVSCVSACSEPGGRPSARDVDDGTVTASVFEDRFSVDGVVVVGRDSEDDGEPGGVFVDGSPESFGLS